MSKSKSFIFEEQNGELVFVGDFEGYYQDTADPWGQAAETEMAHYYRLSRQRTVEFVRACPKQQRILEVGCGHGHVTQLLADAFPKAKLTGLDISSTAIAQAQQRFPRQTFATGNIADPAIVSTLGSASFDVVILNQLLWYILNELPQIQANIRQLLGKDGRLIISNAFAREQRYGTGIIDHFDGAARYFRQSEHFQLLSARFDNDGEEHDDGHFLLRATASKDSITANRTG